MIIIEQHVFTLPEYSITMKISISIITILFLLASCGNGEQSSDKPAADSIPPVATPVAEEKGEPVSDSSGVTFPESVTANQQYAYLKNILDSNNATYIIIEPIQLLTGDKALEAAKKKGDAAFDKTSNKYFLPDGYYIIEEKQTTSLPLAADVKIKLVSNFYRTDNKVKYSNLEALKKIYQKESSWPVLITKNEAGSVAILSQVYLP